jgi:hypothetical protein
VSRKWDAEQIEKIRAASTSVEGGYTAIELAALFGMTRNQIIGICSRNNISLTKPTPGSIAARKARAASRSWCNGGKTAPDQIEVPAHEENIKKAEERKAQPPQPKAQRNEFSVDFMDARANQCRTPLWRFPARTGMVCGRPTEKDRSHCEECRKWMYRVAEKFVPRRKSAYNDRRYQR